MTVRLAAFGLAAASFALVAAGTLTQPASTAPPAVDPASNSLLQAQSAGRAQGAQARREAEVFGGLGTWIDIYDTSLYRAPVATAERLARRGVQTVWIETANDRSPVDVVEPVGLGRLLDALHARGLRVVGWYLPGHVDQALDIRRSRALLRFRTPTGGAFDAIALDIESTRERTIAKRNARMLALLRLVRREATVPLAAIVFPHRGLERHPDAWPRFPWAAVAAQVDAIAPMLYTGGALKGYDATYGYVTRSLRLLRRDVGETPLHAAGGVANRLGEEELRAFADAVSDDGAVIGWSLYDLATTTPAGWRALATVTP